MKVLHWRGLQTTLLPRNSHLRQGHVISNPVSSGEKSASSRNEQEDFSLRFEMTVIFPSAHIAHLLAWRED